VFDSDHSRFFNGIHDQLIKWIAKIGKQEGWAQEPYANPDFSSRKNAICEQLHTLISKIDTYLDHRYKCTIVEEFRIRECINGQIDSLGRIDQYYMNLTRITAVPILSHLDLNPTIQKSLKIRYPRLE
jgi:hypothetical protein